MPSASARCTIPLASRVTGRKGRVHQNAKQTVAGRFLKRTTLRREARMFWIELPAEVIDVRERYCGGGR